MILSWQDLVEIFLSISACYYLFSWLKQDRQARLLTTAYSYCALLFASYALSLNTVHIALITFAPLVVAVLIMLHKDSLQKSFVALHRITPATKSSEKWTEELMRIALVSMNNQTTMTFVLEKHQALDSLLTTSHTLHSSLSAGLAQLLLAYTHAPESFIWLDNHGMVRGYDCTFALSSIDTWLIEATHYKNGLEHALLFSTKTDAFFITTHPESRTFSVVYNGIKHQQISAGRTLELLTAHTNSHQPQENPRNQGELSHVSSNHKKDSTTRFQH